MAWASSDWPLPSTPAMPRISPWRTEKEMSSTARFAVLVEHCQALTSKAGPRGRPAPLSTVAAPARPTIMSQLLLGHLGGGGAGPRGPADHGDPVGDGLDLFELVGD